MWRYELAPPGGGGSAAAGPGVVSREKLTAVLDTLPKGDLLMRGDSVGFPPGGCAFLHTHQGPGIRCLIEGGIRIDYPRPLDLLRAGQPVVRVRARIRCSRRPRPTGRAASSG